MTNRRNSVHLETRKLIVVGDSMTGKRSLLYAFKDDPFDPIYSRVIFETYFAEVQLDGKTFNLALYDTAGQEAYARLRPLSYSDTNVVLICFSVDSPTSASNIIDEWNPEIRHFCGACPVILVACKIDLRKDSETIERLKQTDENVITTEMGQKLAAQIKADAYMECSAKTGEGITELFDLASRFSLRKMTRRKRHSNCAVH